MNEQRDRELGARLDELEVTEHGPGYWESVMTAAGPELAGLRAARRRRGLRLWAPLAAAAAAVAIVLAVALSGSGPGGELPAVQPASAAEAIGYTLNVIDRYPGLTGTNVGQTTDGPAADLYEATQHFVLSPDGSLRLDSLMVPASRAPRGTRTSTGYDALTHVEQTEFDQSAYFPLPQGQSTEGSFPYMYAERTHVAPGPPDDYTSTWFPLLRLRAYLRGNQNDPQVNFSTGQQDGREVWILRTTVVETASAAGGKPVAVSLPVTVVIDAATRLPLSYTHGSFPGGLSGERTTFDVQPLSQAPAQTEFSVPVPDKPGTYVEPSDGFIAGDQGFRRLNGANAAAVKKATFGVAAFPTWMPTGFRVTDAATKWENGSWTNYPADSPPTKGLVPQLVVSQAFRRGYDQAFVSVRTDPRLYSSATEGTGKQKVRVDTSDPFLPTIDPVVAAEWKLHTTNVRLTAGAFAGATAHVVLEPDHWPHLWVLRGPWVATVSGDLTRAEMIRIAESLAPWNPANGE